MVGTTPPPNVPRSESDRRRRGTLWARVLRDHDALEETLKSLTFTLLASLGLTLVMAWPIVLSPSTRIFGSEIVGRHHDPFTVMQQFESGGASGPYLQPVTDLPGVALARTMSPIAAFNVLVLLTFPLTAFATYLLALHTFGSGLGASIAALVFTFAPMRLAHAAYHVHIVQTQWLSLYLLALWLLVDRSTWTRAFLLAAATIFLALSNWYGALIGAVVSPVALIAYGLATPDRDRSRRMLMASGTLAVFAVAGLGAGMTLLPDLWTHPGRYAVPIADLTLHGARWWSYLVPPVDHPLAGAIVRRWWDATNIGSGLLEQQLFLGWSVLVLAASATWAWLRGRIDNRAARMVPVLIVVAAWAALCSLEPDHLPWLKPSGFLYRFAPMFRAYARFGIVTQLMVALLAGFGAARWLTASALWPRVAAAVLLSLAAIEYAPVPSRTRDVLPTEAHRWLVGRTGLGGVFDCTERTPADASLSWLMRMPVTLLAPPIDSCDDPRLADQLAALGHSYVIVRTRDGEAWPVTGTPVGLKQVKSFSDSRVYAIDVPAPPVVTLGWQGFFPVERAPGYVFRWMGRSAQWIVRNTTNRPLRAQVEIELSAFGRPQHLALSLDGQSFEVLTVAVERNSYTVAMALTPGEHQLDFQPLEPPLVADDLVRNGDRRALSMLVGSTRWEMLQP